MSVALLDVNFLVALLDRLHPHHDAAHRWFQRHRGRGFATSPSTINGCARVLSNPSYPTVEATPAEVAASLAALSSDPNHHFWPDTVTITDSAAIRPARLSGHRQITDACLLALAVRNHGVLATFDRSIPLAAVIGAEARDLIIVSEI